MVGYLNMYGENSFVLSTKQIPFQISNMGLLLY